MRYLPIHIDLKDQTILVVGGAGACEAKLRTLLKTPARIKLVSPVISPEIIRFIEEGANIIWHDREFEKADLEGIRLVYAATEDESFNGEIAKLAGEAGILANAADYKAACDFITPALLDRSPVTISIGSEGTSPGLARAIKSDLETRLPKSLGKLALKINMLRKKVKLSLPDLADRQRFWADILSGNDLTSQIRLSGDEIERKVDAKLAGSEDSKKGFVAIIGGGPGDPDLLTFAARQRLHSADVIVYDRLVSQAVLDLGRREAEYIYVGKEPGGKCVPQSRINEILLEQAQMGRFVIRLKSGDPLIFGRADEETHTLKAANIPFEIVPGITAAAAAAASIGTSLTARGKNKAFSIITGHDAKGYAEHDWATISRNEDRLAVYMGVGAAPIIEDRLLSHGMPPKTPITIVENASRDNQVIAESVLDRLGTTVASMPKNGPAVLLIGYSIKNNSLDKQAKKEAAE